MASPVSVSFGDPDGEQAFATWDELEAWISKERAAWEWLNPATPNVDVNSVAQHVRNTFASITQHINNHRTAEHDPSSIQGLLNNAYHPTNGYLRRSDGWTATVVSDARGVGGDEAGAFAYGVLIRKAALSQASTLDHFRGALVAAFPGLGEPAALAQRLVSERANYKSSLRSSLERVDNALKSQDSNFAQQIKRFRGIAARALRRKQDRWTQQQARWAEDAATIVADLRATDEAYRVGMGLQAPVEYWRKKSSDHQTAEDAARKRLYYFFPAALLLLLGSFGGAAGLLLESTGAIPASLYVILSAGLLSVAAVVFWIGRLLTKLYLSEHHLRHDAEERAVMTTTYLALTKEKGAEEADRQIILSALFRPTSDGIVKEDGPVELSLASVLAKLGVR